MQLCIKKHKEVVWRYAHLPNLETAKIGNTNYALTKKLPCRQMIYLLKQSQQQ